jgi:site-specific DNA recombinase
MVQKQDSSQGAVIYTRVSTDEQAENGTSLAGQLDLCRAKAAALGLAVVGEYDDQGVSGARLLTRTGMQNALADIRARRADTLICANLSRFSRDAEHQRTLKREIESAGGRVVFCDMAFDDTPEGDLAFGIMGNFAAYERQVIRKRTMGGKRRRAEEGQQPQRSRPPYGYHIVTNAQVAAGLYPPHMRGCYVVNEDTAPIARRIFADYLTGKSLNRIADRLNADGVPPPGTGRGWHMPTIRFILINPVYKGEPVSGRQQCRQDEARIGQPHKLTGVPLLTGETRRPSPAGHTLTLSAPALVTAEQWQEVQDKMARATGARSGTPRHVRMLSGQTVCPHCGGRAGFKYQKANGRQYAYLVCRCFLAARGAAGERPCVGDLYPVEEVEGATLTAIRRAWECPESVAAAVRVFRQAQAQDPEAASGELRAIMDELDALGREQAAVVQAQVAGIRSGASPDAYADLFADINARRKDLAARRREAEALAGRGSVAAAPMADPEAQAAAFREAWEVLTDPDVPGVAKRDILQTLVDRVVCRKGGADVVFRPGVFGEQEAGAGEDGEILTLHTTCIGIKTQR